MTVIARRSADPWYPAFDTLPAELSTHSMRHATLTEPLVFGTSPALDLDHLRLLREVTSHAVRLHWTIRGRPCFPLDTHVHLVPPAAGTDAESDAYGREWGRRYRYGTFYYRHGPGFVVIKDTRDSDAAARMVVSDGAEAFLALAEGSPGPVPPDLRYAAAAAVEAGLALREGPELLMLPYRMRHWPVPFTAV